MAQILVDGAAEIKAGFDPGAASRDDGSEVDLALEYLRQEGGQFTAVVGRNQEARPPIINDLRRAAQMAGDDRFAHGHRLIDGRAQRFGFNRGVQDDIQIEIDVPHVLVFAGKEDSIL